MTTPTTKSCIVKAVRLQQQLMGRAFLGRIPQQQPQRTARMMPFAIVTGQQQVDWRARHRV